MLQNFTLLGVSELRSYSVQYDMEKVAIKKQEKNGNKIKINIYKERELKCITSIADEAGKNIWYLALS